MAKKKVDDKGNQGSENNKNESEMSAPDDEPNFSDPEDYVDSIPDDGKYITLTLHSSICHLARIVPEYW